jgi:hypothetical protein
MELEIQPQNGHFGNQIREQIKEQKNKTANKSDWKKEPFSTKPHNDSWNQSQSRENQQKTENITK